MSQKCLPNCKICQDHEDNYTKDLIKSGIRFFRWDIILYRIICLTVFIGIMYNWIGSMGIGIGIVLEFVFYFFMGIAEGGAVGDIHNEYPKEEYPPNKCSAGIEGCEICNNEYSHEFNQRYLDERTLNFFKR